MKAAVRQNLTVNAVWIGGLAVVIGALVGGSVLWLSRSRTETARLEQELAGKVDELVRRSADGLPSNADSRTELALTETNALVHDSAERIAELSGAAFEAGVSLVWMRSEDAELDAERDLWTASHELRALGNYRRMASFVDAVHHSRGLPAIEELDLGFGDRDDALEASMRVTWFAAADVEEETP